MKTKRKVSADDDLRAEYDFSKLKGGVRGKFVERYRKGTNLVRLDRDVAQAFPDEAAVNQALRAALKLSEAVRSQRRPSSKLRLPVARTEARRRQRVRRRDRSRG